MAKSSPRNARLTGTRRPKSLTFCYCCSMHGSKLRFRLRSYAMSGILLGSSCKSTRTWCFKCFKASFKPRYPKSIVFPMGIKMHRVRAMLLSGVSQPEGTLPSRPFQLSTVPPSAAIASKLQTLASSHLTLGLRGLDKLRIDFTIISIEYFDTQAP